MTELQNPFRVLGFSMDKTLQEQAGEIESRHLQYVRDGYPIIGFLDMLSRNIEGIVPEELTITEHLELYAQHDGAYFSRFVEEDPGDIDHLFIGPAAVYIYSMQAMEPRIGLYEMPSMRRALPLR